MELTDSLGLRRNSTSAPAGPDLSVMAIGLELWDSLVESRPGHEKLLICLLMVLLVFKQEALLLKLQVEGLLRR